MSERKPFQLFECAMADSIDLTEANEAIEQDKAYAERANKVLEILYLEACDEVDQLRTENESLRADNETLREAVKWGNAQTPNIMLACLRGLRAQLAEAYKMLNIVAPELQREDTIEKVHDLINKIDTQRGC